MTYKTILVHVADARRLEAVLSPSADLARRFGAHLIALGVLPPVIVEPALVPGGMVTINDSQRKAFGDELARMRPVFEDTIKLGGISGEWIVGDAERGSVWSEVVEYGTGADLIVASQPDPHWTFSEIMEAPGDLVLNSGRPVLFIPNSGHHTGLGHKVVVAWNGKREATRAVHDALPILAKADHVSVLWVNPSADSAARDLPAADVCTGLARHGVKCEAVALERPGQTVTEAIAARIRQTNADLLVMGCYGHSRWRELVLGGATRQVLREMSVPVLMSH